MATNRGKGRTNIALLIYCGRGERQSYAPPDLRAAPVTVPMARVSVEAHVHFGLGSVRPQGVVEPDDHGYPRIVRPQPAGDVLRRVLHALRQRHRPPGTLGGAVP